MGEDRAVPPDQGPGRVSREGTIVRRHLLILLSILPAAVALFFPAAPARAQGAYSLNVISTYDNNSFSIYDRRADVYHQVFAGATQDFAGDFHSLTLFYYGAFVLFRTFPSRTYNQHTLGGWYVLQLDHRDEESEEEEKPDEEKPADDGEETGKKETAAAASLDSTKAGTALPVPSASGEDSLVTYLHVRPTVGARYDKRAFDFYDSRSAGVNLLLRRHIAGSLIGRIMGETNYKQYPSLQQFSNLENLGRAGVSATIGEGTELFASAEFGYKNYLNTVTTTSILVRGSGKGKGGARTDTVVTTYSNPGTAQAVISAGIVHSGGSNRSIALSYLLRTNPHNAARATVGDTPIGTSEDEIFDDRYGYQSHELTLTLRLPLFLGCSAEGEALLHRKLYPQAATTLAGDPLPPGNPQRLDQRFGLTLQISRPLVRKGDGGAALTLGVLYAYVRNRSNSAYHDYHIHQAGLSIGAEF